MNDSLVLNYHAASADWPSRLSVAPADIERQVSWLLKRGYRPLTFIDLVRAGDQGKVFAVTFDDAYRSTIEGAFPVLSRLGVPATVYVPTDYAGSERPMSWPGIEQWDDGPYAAELIPMNWEEIGTLAEAGWEIGAHTLSHPHLPEISDEDLARELTESRRVCEERSGSPCSTLAYPFGEYDARVIEATRKAGYEAACTLPEVLNEPSAFEWPRVGVYPADSSTWRYWAKVSPGVRRLRHTPLWNIPLAARAALRRVRPQPADAP
jgi:peptidoglycan/xylan/chitin deacetylase (PgdA/CDA1 family)